MAKTTKRRYSATPGDPRWAKVLARDKAADGAFWYSVSTTGIFCRPWCPSRVAKPEHVRFYKTIAAALAAGFRACKRCQPQSSSLDDINAAIVAKACKLIESHHEPLSLPELAQAVELSPGYFHRLLKAKTGLTPKDYASAERAKRVRGALSPERSLTQAIYDSGFNSNGRFYARSTDILGMTAKQFRSGGAQEDIRFAVGQCSLGAVLVASTDKGVVSILLGDDPEKLLQDLQGDFPQARLLGNDAACEGLVARVVGMIEAPAGDVALPLDIRGSVFQQRVWKALRTIPVGRTATYSQVARRIGSPPAVRAVANACASNHLAIAIPCHRVIRVDGALSGYRWGIERKRALLERESSDRLSALPLSERARA